MAEGDRWDLPQAKSDVPLSELQLVPPTDSVAPSADSLPAPKRSFPAWTIWDVLLILAATVVAIFVCSLTAIAIAQAIPAYRGLSVTALAQKPLLVVGSQMASYPLVIVLMAVIVRRRSGEPFLAAIHWIWPGRSGPWFCAGGIVLAFTVEGLAHFLPIPKSLPMDKFFNDAASAYLMAVFGIVVAPLLEELFFRGMLYPILRRAMGVVIALVLTAAAFAAIHGAQLGYAWAPILSIFIVGLALTLVRQVTDSVASCVLTHSGYNFTLFALLWIGSDHFHHLEKLTALGVYR